MPQWLEMPRSLGGIVLFQFIGACVLYFALAGASALAMRLFNRAVEFPGHATAEGQLGPAILWTLISLAGNAVLSAPFQYYVTNHRSAVYYDIHDRSWGYFAFSIVAYLFVTETVIYWVHRALHGRTLYKWIHSYHHRFRVPTPWAGLAFHPLDSFSQALPHFLCALVLPVYVHVYTAFVVGVTVWAIAIHDRTSIVRWPVINYTGHHTLHHLYNKWNYGQFFTFWDRLAGTYRSPREMEARARAVWYPTTVS